MCKKVSDGSGVSVEKVEKNGPLPSVLVIIAALNEEEGIEPALSELREVLRKKK